MILPYNLKKNGKQWEVLPFLPRFYATPWGSSSNSSIDFFRAIGEFMEFISDFFFQGV